MDPPATYYGQLDKRNPVIIAFKRDMQSFLTQIKQAADNSSQAKGIKILVEIWKKYKHRLPDKLYQEHMLQTADFLYEMKLYQMAQWYGYGLCLLQFSSVKVTEITDVDHFICCFFPEGLDPEQDTCVMKMRAMLGCSLCIFEEVKKCSSLSETGLHVLLRVLNFIKIMMHTCQQHERLSWMTYNGSVHIYNICWYLMTVKCSEQALEYLLWASNSLDLSIPLMTAKYLPLMVTLYCAVCYCYHDIQAEVQAEEFAKRALSKLNELEMLEETSEAAATSETQKVYREASIKLGALMFKRAVFDNKRRPKITLRLKYKTTLKDIPRGSWPCTPTESMLDQFDCRAGQFLGILEALWDSHTRPLQMKTPDDAERHEVVLELLSAGMSILSGVTSTGTGEQRRDDCPTLSADILAPVWTPVDLMTTGDDKIPIMSAVRFIKLLLQYKQFEAFTELSKEMLNFLSGVEGQLFRKAERELILLLSFNNLLFSQGSIPKKSSKKDDKHKSFLLSSELTGLMDTLHISVCGSDPELQPDRDLVLDALLFVWEKLKVFMQNEQIDASEFTQIDNPQQWVWYLSVLCEVAFAYELPTVDCMLMAEMIWALEKQLERTAECFNQKQESAIKQTQRRAFATHVLYQAACEGADYEQLSSSSTFKKSNTELLKKVSQVVMKGLEALARAASTLFPADSSAVTDSAFMQKFTSVNPLSTSSSLPKRETGAGEISEKNESKKAEGESYFKDYERTQSLNMFLLTGDLHLKLDIIHHKVSLKLLQLNEVAESELLDRIKKNKVSKAHFLIQKAWLEHSGAEPHGRSKTDRLLEEASILIEKAAMEERKLFMTTLKAHKTDGAEPEKDENPPPPPILISRTDHSLTFVPAPYNLEGQVSWYQLCARAADGVNLKVRLGDCSIPGTGTMVPVVSGECVLKVDGLQPNQKYVFAVAAYNHQAKLLGNAIGGTTLPVLASMPIPLLSTWGHLAQVAFQTEQNTIAKNACRKLWSHFTDSNSTSNSSLERFAATGLHVPTVQHSSPHLCQLFLTSIFIETKINVQQESLHLFIDSGKFTWEQDARLAECERMLVAVDLTMRLNDGRTAVQAVVTCYRLLAPFIFHQVTCDPVVQVLKKCLEVLEENSFVLKQKWTENISELLVHVVACITYYLSKALRVLKKHKVAAVVMDSGRRLLQELHDAHLEICRIPNQAVASKSESHLAVSAHMKINLLQALHRKDERRTTSEQTANTDNEMLQSPMITEDVTELYDLISSSPLQEAYQLVRKLRHKTNFLEFAALLMQRTMEEGHPDLILNWGETMFQFLSRRDEKLGLYTKYFEGNNKSKQEECPPTPKTKETQVKIENVPSLDETRRKLKRKLPRSLMQCVRTNREICMVENLLTMMSYVVHRNKRRIQLRSMCSEERVWRANINYCVAHAHLVFLYQDLHQIPGGPVQKRYSQFDPFWFSLARSGSLMRRSPQPQPSPEHKAALDEASYDDSRQREDRGSAVRSDDSVTEKNYEEDRSTSQSVEEQAETQRPDSAYLLDSINKAALCLRRAMVLAHRGKYWSLLHHVCQTAWDQSHRITTVVHWAAQFEVPSPVTTDQLSTIFTTLLVVAADLIMDMLNQLQLWSLYDCDQTEEELESSLHFSAPMDDGTLVDLRWVRMLVMHALELLHDRGQWERLAHFALLFNSYTRERYSLVITPLLVHAQRKLLERISSLGGPAVPQPHHVKTQRHSGKEINYRSYASCQLLSGWTTHSAQKRSRHKKLTQTNATRGDAASLKGSERQLSMLLVCVPLDVDDTLRCYRQALEKTPQCLQVLQHSQKLLVQLLAHTQPWFAVQLLRSQSRGLTRAASQVAFSPVVMRTPNSFPYDLYEEDFSAPDAIYGLPISPEYVPTVAAAFSESIQCLQENGHVSLRVLTLHEMGNFHFYTGSMRAAHSCWSEAVNCALQSTGVSEKWDGVSDSSQKTVEQAGVWGCLQAAVLSAKIAQFIFTSDINQRTKNCLLSAHLFKCVLCCSVASPRSDLQYISYSIEDELLPAVDLFSEPRRLHFGTTVTSLSFICNWLFTTGYYTTLLPSLALYLHLVGNVGRDVQRTVEGRILKVRTLTELCLFTEAVTEAVQLTQGTCVILPSGPHTVNTNPQPVKTFCNNLSLLDNLEALEDLMNCDFAPQVSTLYGSTLLTKFNRARVQLLLALANSVHGRPVPVSEEARSNMTDCAENSEHNKQDKLDAEDSGKLNVSTFFKDGELSSEKIKFLLLEGASCLLSSALQPLTSGPCSEVENLELMVESHLLRAKLHLQQGNAALSSEVAASSLVLLQTSPILTRQPAGSQQGSKACRGSDTLQGDCPRAAEAGERIGVFLWLCCRLTLVQSLVANIPETAALFPGKNINEETARVIQEGLDECVRWGDCDIQALLMLEGAELEAQRGRTEDSVKMLQGAVGLLSGRTMPPGSAMALARAALMLSDLRGTQSVTLLRLTQKLLRKQLGVFDQTLTSADENMSPPVSRNIYLPYSDMLNKISLQIEATLKPGDMEGPGSDGSSPPTSRKNHIETDLQTITCLKSPSSSSPE